MSEFLMHVSWRNRFLPVDESAALLSGLLRRLYQHDPIFKTWSALVNEEMIPLDYTNLAMLADILFEGRVKKDVGDEYFENAGFSYTLVLGDLSNLQFSIRLEGHIGNGGPYTGNSSTLYLDRGLLSQFEVTWFGQLFEIVIGHWQPEWGEVVPTKTHLIELEAIVREKNTAFVSMGWKSYLSIPIAEIPPLPSSVVPEPFGDGTMITMKKSTPYQLEEQDRLIAHSVTQILADHKIYQQIRSRNN